MDDVQQEMEPVYNYAADRDAYMDEEAEDEEDEEFE